jgi:wyosine [tRNA(Phe)-imidazoG37] synthetase (radical SAM superfamily)
MLPILKEMYKRNLLSTNNDLFVDFQGGDISVLSEFNDIVQELINHNVYFIRFTTNNIVFQPLISDLLHNRKAELMTSLDCGSADSYKKIKRVDKFHNTVENLRHYMSDTPNANIFIKYITVFGVNDNEKDVNEFLDLMFDIQIPTVSFEIDSRNIMMNPNIKFVIPKHYYKLLNIFENRCKESKTTKLFINPHTVEVMQKGFFGGQI